MSLKPPLQPPLQPSLISENKSSHKSVFDFIIKTELDELLDYTNQLRQKHFGNKIEICAIINAKSGNCGMDCKFCSQSSFNNSPVNNFPLLTDDKLNQEIDKLGDSPILRCGLVTSGGALSTNDLDKLLAFIKSYTTKCSNDSEQKKRLPSICASLGRLTKEQLQTLKNSGLTRYHHNLESSESFYPNLCTTQTWKERVNTVLAVKELGLELCCGGIFGVGEKWDDRINFAFELLELGINNIPLNFLYPHKGTPLATQKILNEEEALRIIALFRYILPHATLRICGGRNLIFKEHREKIFSAGANAIMTGNYLTSTGEQIESDLLMLKKLNLEAVY